MTPPSPALIPSKKLPPTAAQIVPTGQAPRLEVPFEQLPPKPPQPVKPKPSGLPINTPPPAKTAYTSESSKWKHLISPYLKGNGIELATGGDPIVATSIQFELPEAEYAHYNSNQPLRGVVHWRSKDAVLRLPFKDGTLDYVASSHLLEDYADWWPLLIEWTRVLKKGGVLVVCLPDKKRWVAAVAGGQIHNFAHKHETFVGELSAYAPKLGLAVIMDRFTECPPGDYNVAFVAKRV